MRPRHAGALILIGWYLLIPPVITAGGPKAPAPLILRYAPLTLWHRVSSFDDETDCEYYLEDTKRAYEDPSFRAELDWRDEWIAKEFGTMPSPVTGETRLRRWFFAQCVASGDPRLKASP